MLEPHGRDRTVTAMSSTRTVTGAGVIATAALVLLFGNQAVTEWIARHSSERHGVGMVPPHAQLAVLGVRAPRRLRRPRFATCSRRTCGHCSWSLFVAADSRLVAKSITGGGGRLPPRLGGAHLRLRPGRVPYRVHPVQPEPPRRARAAAAGSAYGLFVGWIVGIATATAKRGA